MTERLKIMQAQVGHSYASTTGLYTSVSADWLQTEDGAADDRPADLP
jgi:site-specific recombinase XerD